MNKSILLFIAAACMALSCNKTTNNNYGSGQPAFVISGLTDVKLTNRTGVYAYLPLQVQYADSSQENVTLSLSPLPAGIAIDTSWVTSGIPTFSTTLTFYDTTAAGAAPGTYPITLTAASAKGTKTYTVNLIVHAAPPCSSYMTGSYFNCYSYCSVTSNYTDVIYTDASDTDKVWFTNFNNTGKLVYALITDCNGTIAGGSSVIMFTVPTQTVGGITFAGTGYTYTYYRETSVTLTSPSSCQFTDN